MKSEFYLKRRLKPIHLPSESEALAEFIGIILGDGNLNKQKIKGRNSFVYQLRIACHSVDDKDYYSAYLPELFHKLFAIVPSFYFQKNNNAVHVYSHKKALIQFLIGKGLVTGNKQLNQVEIPDWVIDNDEYLKSCLRGLFDTDGSIFRMSNKDPRLLRISFCSYNATLMNSVRLALLRLGYHPSKYYNNSTNLSRKSDVAKYLNEIGFSNMKHLNRLKRMIAP